MCSYFLIKILNAMAIIKICYTIKLIGVAIEKMNSNVSHTFQFELVLVDVANVNWKGFSDEFWDLRRFCTFF